MKSTKNIKLTWLDIRALAIYLLLAIGVLSLHSCGDGVSDLEKEISRQQHRLITLDQEYTELRNNYPNHNYRYSADAKISIVVAKMHYTEGVLDSLKVELDKELIKTYK